MGNRTFDCAAGREFIARVEELGRSSDSPNHYTRTYLTHAHREAAARIAQWMREAGMEVRVDAVGSVIGRYEAAEPGARTLLMGSHFDSVRNGGKFDGVMGILVPIACVAQLSRDGVRLPVTVEIVAFADEEGTRFQTGMLASRTLVGRFDPAVLDRTDADGVSLGQAMREAGLDPQAIRGPQVDLASLAAYVEVHIEQGPVLLAEGRALGVVTSIAAGTRHALTVRGVAGHAGTVPMPMRHDALAAAAEMVVAIERRCGAGGSLVGTVGILQVKDGSSNVIPGEVAFTVDIRAGDSETLARAQQDVFAECDAIAARRGVSVQGARTHDVKPTPCAPWLQDRIAAAIERVEGKAPARRLPSGAGHDAMILAEVTDAGMMFVRCGAGGVSHNPAETVSAEDADAAIRALGIFLREFPA
ncbi:MAG TPA: allantoate amidohydrolase [Usitatibacter sp.]|jgi:hydantoinase/carbamoylase family amidase|nr:allantoate amidohydrolase [Usitatibacter sp.]